MIQFIGTVIIWVVGAQEVFKGNMTIGTIMALMNYQAIIMNPIIGIAQFANELPYSRSFLKRLINWTDSVSGSEARRWKEITTVIRFP